MRPHIALIPLFALGAGCGSDPRPPTVATGGGGGASAGNGEAGGDTSTDGATGPVLELCPSALTGGQPLYGCSAPARDAFASCVGSACRVEQQNCFGSGLDRGVPGGPCADYLRCTSGCGCDDDACISACGASADCAGCLISLASCALGCASQAACDAGVADSGVAQDAGAAACAALQSCCAGLGVNQATTCQFAYNQSLSGGPSSCAQELARFCPGG
jgi:hypothetical protein